MSKKWLLLDCNYLCHRAKHTTGGLSHKNIPTGVIYGFLKTVSYFQELFNTPYVIFCWDSKTSKREKVFPAYKANRKDKYKDMDEATIKFEKEFRRQMVMLRRIYLPVIGYKNIFIQKGYEADDIIASICYNLPMLDEAIIISSDQDLYQLLNSRISLYNPIKRKILTLRGFRNKYEIIPEQWIIVKCLAGCTTDEIPGIRGIGEKTVIRYLKGELDVDFRAYQKIEDEKTEFMKRNYPLVALPFAKTKVFRFQEDEISRKGWSSVVKALGMKSLRDKAPIFKHRRKLK